MDIYFAKPFKSIDFISLGVKRTHIKNILYIQGVAKISNCYKNITQSLKSAIIIYYRKFYISNDKLSF